MKRAHGLHFFSGVCFKSLLIPFLVILIIAANCNKAYTVDVDVKDFIDTRIDELEKLSKSGQIIHLKLTELIRQLNTLDNVGYSNLIRIVSLIDIQDSPEYKNNSEKYLMSVFDVNDSADFQLLLKRVFKPHSFATKIISTYLIHSNSIAIETRMLANSWIFKYLMEESNQLDLTEISLLSIEFNDRPPAIQKLLDRDSLQISDIDPILAYSVLESLHEGIVFSSSDWFRFVDGKVIRYFLLLINSYILHESEFSGKKTLRIYRSLLLFENLIQTSIDAEKIVDKKEIFELFQTWFQIVRYFVNTESIQAQIDVSRLDNYFPKWYENSYIGSSLYMFRVINSGLVPFKEVNINLRCTLNSYEKGQKHLRDWWGLVRSYIITKNLLSTNPESSLQLLCDNLHERDRDVSRNSAYLIWQSLIQIHNLSKPSESLNDHFNGEHIIDSESDMIIIDQLNNSSLFSYPGVYYCSRNCTIRLKSDLLMNPLSLLRAGLNRASNKMAKIVIESKGGSVLNGFIMTSPFDFGRSSQIQNYFDSLPVSAPNGKDGKCITSFPTKIHCLARTDLGAIRAESGKSGASIEKLVPSEKQTDAGDLTINVQDIKGSLLVVAHGRNGYDGQNGGNGGVYSFLETGKEVGVVIMGWGKAFPPTMGQPNLTLAANYTPGGIGGSGQNGGRAGNLFVRSDLLESKYIRFYAKGGIGGSGGKGGYSFRKSLIRERDGNSGNSGASGKILHLTGE